VFCTIVNGAAPRSVVAENETTIAFMDILPVTPGHLLVVPKVHATHLAGLPLETGAQMMATAMQCAAALRASPLRTEGINLFLADGAAAGQEVFHVHLHVLPRFLGDGFALALRYDPAPPRPALDEHARLLAEIIAS
jgi:diadenosine tetraphosphate (Ap4A) HIT family hydrolase